MFHTPVLMSVHTNYNVQNAVSFMGHGQRQSLCVPPYCNIVLVMSQVGHAMGLWSELCFGPVCWSAAAEWWEGLRNALWSVTTPDARKPGYGC